MLAHREKRQFQQPAGCEMRLDAAQRVGAGDDHRAIMRVNVIVERDRLKPQHRRPHHLETPGAQTGSGGLVVGRRTGDENSHGQPLAGRRLAAADDCTLRPRNARA
jgi:hypothetical protein